MKAIELLVLSLDPSRVYHFGEQVAWTVFTYITPVLLVIAVAVRTLETQLDNTTSMGKWERAIRDFFLFGFLIGSYFGIMMMFNVLMNEIYVLTHDLGNFELLAQEMKRLLADANQGEEGKIGTAWRNFNFWLRDIYRLIMTVFFWASSLFVITTHVILKGAHGMIYTFVLVYGLIAIPLSMTSNFKLLKGWATLLGGTLLWPIVEGLLIGFFGVLFQDASQEIINIGGVRAYQNDRDFKAFFSVVNVTLAFMMILAPVISATLVANANSMFALVAPFASGAMSVGLGALAAGKAVVPGGKGFGVLRSGATTMGLIGPGALAGEGGSAGGSGGSSSVASYSGGPSARAGGDSTSSSGGATSVRGASSAGVEARPSDSGPSARSGDGSKDAPEASLSAKEEKRIKSQKGHFVNQARKKTNIKKDDLL